MSAAPLNGEPSDLRIGIWADSSRTLVSPSSLVSSVRSSSTLSNELNDLLFQSEAYREAYRFFRIIDGEDSVYQVPHLEIGSIDRYVNMNPSEKLPPVTTTAREHSPSDRQHDFRSTPLPDVLQGPHSTTDGLALLRPAPNRYVRVIETPYPVDSQGQRVSRFEENFEDEVGAESQEEPEEQKCCGLFSCIRGHFRKDERK